MGVDPAIVQNVAGQARADAPVREVPTLRLDPALVQRIAQKVPIFAGMSQDVRQRRLNGHPSASARLRPGCVAPRF